MLYYITYIKDKSINLVSYYIPDILNENNREINFELIIDFIRSFFIYCLNRIINLIPESIRIEIINLKNMLSINFFDIRTWFTRIGLIFFLLVILTICLLQTLIISIMLFTNVIFSMIIMILLSFCVILYYTYNYIMLYKYTIFIFVFIDFIVNKL